MSIQIDGIQIFDDSGESLEVRLRRAAERYEEKFGHKPTHCKVNEGLVSGEIKMLGITVIGVREIMPKQMLIGVEDNHEPAQ